MGAKVIEKHFIIDKSIGGPDSSFSLDEKEFTEMVKMVRIAESSLGKIDFNLTEKQQSGRNFSRSLYIVRDVKKGEKVTTENVRSIRPGYGLHPKNYNKILGKKFKKNYEKGTRMSMSYILD